MFSLGILLRLILARFVTVNHCGSFLKPFFKWWCFYEFISFISLNSSNGLFVFVVSLKYGYGLMDTSAMVDLAESWNNVPEQHTCEKVANTSDV